MNSYSDITNLSVSIPIPGVLHVQLNKPKQINSVDTATWKDYGTVFNRAATDSNVNAIVLSGAGDRGFCSGLDIKAATKQDSPLANTDTEPSRRAVYIRRHIREFQQAIKASYDCPKPVISVAHGVSFGLAMDILTNTDIRYCTSDSNFSVREIQVGMAADIGTLQQLTRVVGNQSWVREIVFTGRSFGANEAVQQGFVSRSFETKEEALRAAFSTAKQLAAMSPVALQGAKENLNYSVEHTIDEGLNHIAMYNSSALQTDFPIGLQAALTKKPGRYEKL